MKDTKVNWTLTIISFVYFLPGSVQHASAQAPSLLEGPPQEQTDSRVIQTLNVKGQPVKNATVFASRGNSIHVFGSPDNVRLIQSGDLPVHSVATNDESMNAKADGTQNIDAAALGVRASDHSYVVHPEHGFAFVPPQESPVRVFRLQPAAHLKLFIPKRYSPDDFVVLACWMNRYADPISTSRIPPARVPLMASQETASEFGAVNTPNAAPWDPTLVYDPWSVRFSDWRLKTMVTHWNVVPITITQKEQYANQATVVMPPGEVRVTLIPKAAINDRIKGTPAELERLLLFGGPTRIKVVQSNDPDDQMNLDILPSEAMRDIEFMGRPSTSAMPNWADKATSVFLTRLSVDVSEAKDANSEGKLCRSAEGNRSERSLQFLGRIAHRIGKDRYLAVGVPFGGRYFVWSVNESEIAGLTRSARLCDYPILDGALPAIQVKAVSHAKAATFKSEPAEVLPRRRTDPELRRIYQLVGSVGGPQRTLIDLTKRAVFQEFSAKSAEENDPNFDPFSAPRVSDPNKDVGVIRLDQIDRKTLAVIPTSTAKVATRSDYRKQVAPTRPTVGELRARIDKLDEDLSRAKKLLQQIEGES